MGNKRITINDKTFELSIPEATIQEAVKAVADRIKADYGDKNPVFLVVLNGAFVFAADIFRHVDYPSSVAFVKVSSYAGLSSCGKISEQLPIPDMVKGRHVVVLEDIVERGYTMEYILDKVREHEAASVEICAFSFKPQRLEVPELKVKYVGMTLPDAFIVGYGLDYNSEGRLLRDIYSLVV